jgi:hypothetical protein
MPRLGLLVVALGIAQIVSWGSLFYSIGVLGPSMSRDVGVSEVFLFGAFTAGLLVSGALSPLSGRMVDERGGGFVLAAGSVLGAAALIVIATSTHGAVLLAGWLLAGAAMAACLYDTGFATLSQQADAAGFRRSVTVLTIFGGFASTVFWPLSQVLMDLWGWRVTLGIYAGLHLLVCLPIHRGMVPRHPATHPAVNPGAARASSPAERPRALRLLNASFILASFVSAVVAVHMVSLLVAQGLTQAQAVSVAMLMGPMQVTGRIAEFGFAKRINVRTLGGITFALFSVAIVLLVVAVDGFGPAAFFFVVAFGVANGLFTIMRGTTPGELFGRERLGALLGYLARGSLYARAVAPACFSGILAVGLTRGAALSILAATALAGWVAFFSAVRAARRDSPP